MIPRWLTNGVAPLSADPSAVDGILTTDELDVSGLGGVVGLQCTLEGRAHLEWLCDPLGVVTQPRSKSHVLSGPFALVCDND